MNGRVPRTKTHCGASAPTLDMEGTTVACLLIPGHSGRHAACGVGMDCEWDDEGRFFATRRPVKDSYSLLLLALAQAVGGNARMTWGCDRHGIYTIEHSTRGTFRAATLRDAIKQLLEACQVDVPFDASQTGQRGPPCP